ncbi:hypothetical protein MTR_1g069330 [Medicago truncatula]|uniref:Uncharacterized protein n=1 Tax=Medicago truncatula TaxID=3880 RepID=A0A072VLG7_MEDTR|nr:hypothetical protein MTR_1g069330 [Medicago truncatula]
MPVGANPWLKASWLLMVKSLKKRLASWKSPTTIEGRVTMSFQRCDQSIYQNLELEELHILAGERVLEILMQGAGNH